MPAMDLELLAWGFGLVEAPRTGPDGVLWFSDATNGRVHRRRVDGTVEVVLPDRPMVGGLALHADGGVVLSGRDVVHWRDGEVRVLLDRPGVRHWNDLQPDAEGRIVVGSVRRDVWAEDPTPTLGECVRIGPGGAVDALYDGIDVSNGIGFSPDGRRMYHVDSPTKGIWVHDVEGDGSLSGRRHIGGAAFLRGIPDGMCVDADGGLWVAHFGGRRVVHLSADGDELGAIAVPAKAVTSCAFGGPGHDELYIVTADNTEHPARGGSIFRAHPGVAGVPTPLARV